MDTRCSCFRQDITLIPVIELPVDAGVGLEIALVDRSCFDRVGAEGNRKHATSWVIVAGGEAVLNSTAYSSDVISITIHPDDRCILPHIFYQRHSKAYREDAPGTQDRFTPAIWVRSRISAVRPVTAHYAVSNAAWS